MWDVRHPVHIRWSDDLSQGLQGLLPPGRGLLLVYAAGFMQTREALPLVSLLNRAVAYSGVDTNPSLQDVQQAIDFSRELDPAWIIAVGGGSVMDTAKAVRLSLASGCRDVEELIARAASLPWQRSPTLVAVPTTHGTGAELTSWATVWDTVTVKKRSLAAPGNFPDCALYVPALTASLPLAASLASTLDAMSHALEALWNRNANPIADEFAFAALQLISHHLPGLGKDTSLDCRSALLRAALFSGLAFSSTRTAAAHSISYPLTLAYQIPHGIACSLPLAALWQVNAPFMEAKAARLLTLLGVPTAAVFFRDINRALAGKIPFSLAEYGVRASDLEHLARASFTEGRMENNLVDLDLADVRSILQSMFEGERDAVS